MIRPMHLIAAIGIALIMPFGTSTPSEAQPPWQRYQSDNDRGHPGRGKWKREKYRDKYDRRDRRDRRRERRHSRRRHEFRHGGPPPWAPAHGYRRKYRRDYYADRHYRESGIVVEIAPAAPPPPVHTAEVVVLPAVGVGTCHREAVGTILGGAAGALVGSKFGKGDGKTAATIGGAIIGLMIGGDVGRQMDEVDQNCIGQALEQAPTGKAVAWKNPDDGAAYEVTPTKTFQTDEGRYCREYQTTVVIDGRTQNAYGTACRQPDGSWKKEPG